MDAQLPPALARWLTERGHDAAHVVDIAMEKAGDREIWRYASKHDSVIVSKDEDFVSLRIMEPHGPSLLWVRLGNTTTSNLLARLETSMPRIEEALAAGERLVEFA